MKDAGSLFTGRRTAVLSIQVTGDGERYRKPSMWCSVDLLHITSEVCTPVLSFQSGRTAHITRKMPNSPASGSAFFHAAVLYLTCPIILDEAGNAHAMKHGRVFPEPSVGAGMQSIFIPHGNIYPFSRDPHRTEAIRTFLDRSGSLGDLPAEQRWSRACLLEKTGVGSRASNP